MREICFLKSGNTVKMHYVTTDDFCKVKNVYIISINFLKLGLYFILFTLYLETLAYRR
jgi:hypothetical protein